MEASLALLWWKRQTGQGLSCHFTRHSTWKLWLHTVVSTWDSIRSMQMTHMDASCAPSVVASVVKPTAPAIMTPPPPACAGITTCMKRTVACRGEIDASPDAGSPSAAPFDGFTVPTAGSGRGDEGKGGDETAVTPPPLIPPPAGIADDPGVESAEVARMSKLAEETKTMRQRASSKLLNRLPLHWRKRSSVLPYRATGSCRQIL